MKNILSILFLILALQSCLNLTDPEHQAQYIESYRSFDKEMVGHFPKKLPNNWVATSFGSPKYINEYCNSTELSLKIKIASKEKFETLKKQLEKEAKVIKNSSDSCLLIVDSKEKRSLINCNSYYPVPQETVYDFKKEKWKKIENSEIALIDYKPGIFIENKFLTPKKTLPENWVNGFSKGYAFNKNEQTIMYWLIIW
jgi:hypothetical protein